MNRITLQPTIFINHPDGSRAYGYRLYDDYGQTYYNSWESIPNDDLEILSLALEDCDFVAAAMFGHMIEHGCGLSIGDTRYDWDDIKHLFHDHD